MAGKGIPLRNIIITAVIVMIVIAIGYYFLSRSSDENGDQKEDIVTNHPPTADAGFDQVIAPGEEVRLSGTSSFDPDDDDLIFRWDLDDSVDSDLDEIGDNDVDLMGDNVTWSYPIPENTITYRVTLTVSDGEKWDKDTTLITIRVEDNIIPPEITLTCRYGNVEGGPSYLDPHYIITIESTTSNENILNFTYMIVDPEDNVLYHEELRIILINTYNNTIRYRDITSMGMVSQGDMILIRDVPEIPEGSTVLLYYLDGLDPVGEVDLSRT
ncbi:MAG: PKD domain-containing protein [Thermoplasmata archaeon]|nr:PKD domain-containing protein [Thermoplasmata archaeon]